jgi:cation transport ATPase
VAPTKARRREEQGRLFWLWLLTLPIILIRAAAFAFGAPWPTPLTQRFAMAMLAFPVLFMVGNPLFRDAKLALDGRRPSPEVAVAAIVLVTYGSGLLALIAPTPPVAGLSAVVVSTYFSVRYLLGRY